MGLSARASASFHFDLGGGGNTDRRFTSWEGKTIEGGTEDWAAAVELGVGLIFVKVGCGCRAAFEARSHVRSGNLGHIAMFLGFRSCPGLGNGARGVCPESRPSWLPIATLLTWALSGVIYRYLYETYKSHQQTMNGPNPSCCLPKVRRPWGGSRRPSAMSSYSSRSAQERRPNPAPGGGKKAGRLGRADEAIGSD